MTFPTNNKAGNPYKWSSDLNIYNTFSLWMWGVDYTPGVALQNIPELNSRIRFDDNTQLRNTGANEINIDTNDYMSAGPGRFATLAHSIYTQFFFRNLTSAGQDLHTAFLSYAQAEGVQATNGYYEFTIRQFKEVFFADQQDATRRQQLINANGPNELAVSLYQYDIPRQSGESQDDYLLRAFAVGSEVYDISGAVFRISADGTERDIRNAVITPDEGQDYDFKNSNTEGRVEELGRKLDSFGLSDSVGFNFTPYTGADEGIYTRTQYDSDIRDAPGVHFNYATDFDRWVDVRDRDIGRLNFGPQANFYLFNLPKLERAWRDAGLLDQFPNGKTVYGTNEADNIDLTSYRGSFLGGQGAANTAVGGAGDDVLTASVAADTLTGGEGADTYRNVGNGDRIIVDNRNDKIILGSAFGLGDSYVFEGELRSYGDATSGQSTQVFGSSDLEFIVFYRESEKRLIVGHVDTSQTIIIDNYEPGYAGIDLEGVIANPNSPSAQPPECFPAGTLILMADGSRKPIEDVVAGEEVFAFDPDEQSGRGDFYAKRVSANHVNRKNRLLTINDCFRATPGHRVLTGEGNFKQLGELGCGDILIDEDGQNLVIKSIQSTDDKVEVYNLTVDSLHTYVADGVRVHNDSFIFFKDELGATQLIIGDGNDPSSFGVLEITTVDNDGNFITAITLDNGDLVNLTGSLRENDPEGTISAAVQAELSRIATLSGEEQARALDDLIHNRIPDVDFKTDLVNVRKLDNGEIKEIEDAGVVGQEFGTQLSNTIVLENPFADFGLEVVLETVGENLSEFIKAGGLNKQLRLGNFNILQNVQQELLANVNTSIDARQGQISSFLSSRLVVALGIEGFAGEFVQGLSDTAINVLIDAAQLVARIRFNPVVPTAEMFTALANAGVMVDGNPIDAGSYASLSDELKKQYQDQYREIQVGNLSTTLKNEMRATGENLLVNQLQSQVDGLLQGSGLGNTAQNFVGLIVDPLIDFSVEKILDLIRPDTDSVNGNQIIEVVSGENGERIKVNPEGLKDLFKAEAQSRATMLVSDFIIDGIGLEGDSFGEQFGAALTKQLVANVIGGLPVIGDGDLFAGGVNFEALFDIPQLGSSLIVSSIADELGLSGVGKALFTQVGTDVVSTIGKNIVSNINNESVNLFSNVSINPIQILNIGVSFGVSKLTDAIASNPAGQLGAQIGGLIGSVIPGVGQILGPVFQVLGALIGNLFGTTPRAGADLVYDRATGEFIVGASYKKGKGKREVAEGLAAQAGDSINAVVDLIGGEILNPNEITPGHYGTYKDRYTYRENGRNDTADHSFNSIDGLISFGVLNALEEMKFLGGGIFLKRALHQSLENQKNSGGIRVTGAEDSGFAKTGNDLSLILADLTVAGEYAQYFEDPQIINALIDASPKSAFSVGWAITFQRAYELGLHRRNESDWYGGWEYFLEDNGGVASTFEFAVDASSNERLIVINELAPASARIIGDTIASAGKDQIVGTGGNDNIVVNSATLDVSVSPGVEVNGATPGEDYDIDTAAIIRGGDGNDTIFGGDRGNDLYGEGGNDSLVGGATADWLFGGDGDDTLEAGASDDGNYLSGDAGNDSLEGAGGSDWLAGGDGADTLRGGAGGDVIDGGAGIDILRGGAGDDRYIWRGGDGADDLMETNGGASDTAALQRLAELRNGTGQIVWSSGAGSVFTSGGVDTLVLGEGIGFDNILFERIPVAGQDYDDLKLIIDLDRDSGTPNEMLVMQEWFNPLKRIEYLQLADGQTINLGAFEAFIQGTDGNDTLFGTNGNDFVYGGKGDDNIYLLRGDDFGVGGAGSDIITGDLGNDIVVGGDDGDRVMGGAGRDRVIGGRGADDVYGGSGNDLIVGDEGDDTLIGGFGDDIFKISRGDGQDVIYDALTDNWDVVWSGQDGDGDSQPDGYVNGYTLDTATGQVAKNGEVVFDGQRWVGRWRYDWDVQKLERHVVTGAIDGADQGYDRIEFDLGIDITDFYGERRGNDLIIGIADGSGAPASIDGFADKLTFNDWFALGAPIEEFFFAGSGLFTLRAFGQEAGTDKYALAAVNLTGAADGDSGNNIVFGSVGDETLQGHDGDDALLGQAGEDSLYGGAGDDNLIGGGGGDLLDGGSGADVLDGGAGFDMASYASSAVGVSVNLGAGVGLNGDADGDSYTDIEGVIGSLAADTLEGDAEDNELEGGAGDDSLRGRLGADTYIYRLGDGGDTIDDAGDAAGADIRDSIILEDVLLKGAAFARNGNDLLVSFAGSSDVIRIVNFADNGRIEDIVFADGLSVSLDDFADAATHDADFVVGSAATPTLQGLDGDDTLSGRGEADRLEGGAGDDFLAPGDATALVDGGDGVDTLYLGDLTAGVTVNLGAQPGGASGNPGGGNADFSLGGAAFIELDAGNGTVGISPVTAGVGVSINAINPHANPIGGELGITGEENGPMNLAGYAVYEIHTVGYGEIHTPNGKVDTLTVAHIVINASEIWGTEYTDRITGRKQAEIFRGGGGDDGIWGSWGDDTLYGDSGDDFLSGGSGDDHLHVGAGNDDAEGGDGVDTVHFDAAYTSYSTPADNNGVITVSGPNGDVITLTGVEFVTFAGGAAISVTDWLNGVAPPSEGGQYTNVENVTGTDSADTITGDANANRLDGRAGSDTLEGAAGGDTISGGEGADHIGGGADDDVLFGDAGADTIAGGAGADLIYGGAGNDVITTGAGGTVIEQDSSGQDVVVDIANTAFGDDGDDALIGGADADSLVGGAGDDALNGGAGADTLVGDGGNDVIDGGDGADVVVISAEAETTGQTRIVNAVGYDVLEIGIAGAPEDLWFSLSGSDLVIESFAEPGRSVYVEDWVTTANGFRENLPQGVRAIYVGGQAISHGAATALADALAGVSVTPPSSLADLTEENRQAVLDAHAATWQARDGYLDNETLVGGAGGDVLTADANLTGGVLIDGLGGNDTLTGAGDNDTINGGLGNDVIAGLDGDDLLDGGAGADMVDGGAGDDTLVASGADSLQGGAGSDVFRIEAIADGAEISETAGGAGDEDTIVFADITRLSDLVAGRGGAAFDGLQVVSSSGSAGADDLFLANGKDGSSNLSVTGHYAGGETVEYVELADRRRFALSMDETAQDGVNTLIAGGDTGDTLTGASGSDALYASGGDDSVSGAAGDDALFGGEGADTLMGDAGDDTLYGGAGADSLDGGAGRNWVSYEDALSAITFDADAASASTGAAQGDMLTNIYGVQGTDFADTMLGKNLGSDVFDGGAGDDTLDGRGGDDIFINSAGDDFFEGGDGADTVIFKGLRAEYDTTETNFVRHIATGERDAIRNIETLRFDDIEISLGVSPNNAPRVVDAGQLPDETIRVGALFERSFGREGEPGALFEELDAGDILTYSAALTDGSALPAWLGFDPVALRFSGTPPASLIGSSLDIRVTASDGIDDTPYDFTLTFDPAGVVLNGTTGADDLSTIGNPAAGADTLTGGDGDDTLEAGEGADTVDGGAGLDVASYANAAGPVAVDLRTQSGTAGDALGDTLIGIESVTGSGHDDTIHGYIGDNELVGGAGNDSVYGHGGVDTLVGGAGDDFLAPGSTASEVDGGAGVDTLYFGDLTGGVTVDLGALQTAGQGLTASYYDLGFAPVSVDEVDFDAAPSATEIVAAVDRPVSADPFWSGGPADYFAARYTGVINVETAGQYTFRLTSDDGSKLFIDNALVIDNDGRHGFITSTFTLALGVGAHAIDLRYFEAWGNHGLRLEWESADAGIARQVISGAVLSTTTPGGPVQYANIENVIGTDSADTITGDATANRLEGGAGDDTLVGGDGADTIDGGAGVDVVSYAAASSGVNIAIDSVAGSGGALGDVVSAVEHLIGSDYNDTLTGNDLNNTLEGGLGNDELHGLGMRDHIYGGAGNDSLYGGAGGDFLYGDDGNDYIEAGTEGDQLYGGGGDDTLVGGQGNDSYMQGRTTGHDTINNYDTDNGRDIITYAADVSNTDLWFEKVGRNLVVSILGEPSSVTITDWFDAQDLPAENFVVDMIIAGAQVADQEVDVPSLLAIMDGLAKPASFAALTPSQQASINAVWSPSAPPVLTTTEDLSSIVISENDTAGVTLRFTVSDAETPADLLTVTASTSGSIFPASITQTYIDATTRDITFVPSVANAFGMETIDVVVTDQAGLTDTISFTITVDEAADAPTLSIPTPNLNGNEGQPIALDIQSDLTDMNGNEGLEIEISGSSTGWTLNNGSVQADGAWLLTKADLAGLAITPPAGSGEDITLTVTARSRVPTSLITGDDVAETTGTITIDVNGAPTGAGIANPQLEEDDAGNVVGELTAIDPDSGGSHTFTISDSIEATNADAANFEIALDGVTLKLKDTVSVDYEDPAQRTQNIIIVVTDQDGLSFEQAFEFQVVPRNDQPTRPSYVAIDFNENDAAASVTLSGATDPDGMPGVDLDYAFALTPEGSGNAGGLFAITNGAANTAVLGLNQQIDYEFLYGKLGQPGYEYLSYDAATDNLYIDVTFLATEEDIDPTDTLREISEEDLLVSPTQIARINVRDVNEAPENLALIGGTLSVSETAANGAYIATFGAVDPDIYNTAFSTLKYSLVSNPGNLFRIDEDTGQLRVNNAAGIDYDTGDRTHTIRVRAQNASDATLSVEKTFTIDVNNVDDTNPEVKFGTNGTAGFDSLNGLASKPGENSEGQSPVIAYVKGRDPDGIGDAFKYSIISGNGFAVNGVRAFRIDENTGVITINGDLDFEHQSDYRLIVEVSEVDKPLQKSTTTIDVEVQDEDDLIYVHNLYNTPGNSLLTVGAQLSGYYVTHRREQSDNSNNDGWLSDKYEFFNPGGILVAEFNQTEIWGDQYENYIEHTKTRLAGYRWRDEREYTRGENEYIEYSELWHLSGDVPPIIFDLDGDGVEINSAGATNIIFDADNDGFRQSTDWVGADDGLLVLDRNGDGVINNGSEISFVEDLPGARTDLEGLAAFDSNGDAVFDARDARFGEFQIWQDANQDGVSQAGELLLLEQAGIASLDLTPVPTGIEIGDPVDALILNTSFFTRTDGSTGELGDAVFRYSSFEEDENVAPSTAMDAPVEVETSLTGVKTAEVSVPDPIDDNARMQSLFNGFLGKLQTGEYEIGLERYAAVGDRFAVAEVGAQVEPQAASEADAAASLNRLVDAMAAFESHGDGLGVNARERAGFESHVVTLAAY